jgi:hypothetical protein
MNVETSMFVEACEKGDAMKDPIIDHTFTPDRMSEGGGAYGR